MIFFRSNDFRPQVFYKRFRILPTFFLLIPMDVVVLSVLLTRFFRTDKDLTEIVNCLIAYFRTVIDLQYVYYLFN